MTDELHHLAAAYALDALDDDERVGFETHLAACATCRSDVASFREATGRLAAAAPVDPPAPVRDRVLAQIGEIPQVRSGAETPPAVADLAERRRRRTMSTILAAAAALVVVVTGAFLIGATDRSSDVDDVLAATDAVETTLLATADTTGGEVVVVWSPSERRAVVLGDGLTDPGDDLVYELWAIDGEVAVPAGLFEPDDGSLREVTDVGDVTPEAWGITIEPAGGSERPTTPIVFLGQV